MTEGFAPPPGLGESAARPVANVPGSGAWGAPAPQPPEPRPRPRRRRSRGAILAWIVGGAAALAIGGGVIADLALTADSARRQPVERGFTGGLEGVQAVAGLCLIDAPEGASVGALTAVACAEPHRAETLAELALSGSWPGDDAVARQATDFCAAQVAKAVPAALAPELRWRVWAPTARTWAQGDRTALCVVVADRDLTGSVEAGTAAFG